MRLPAAGDVFPQTRRCDAGGIEARTPVKEIQERKEGKEPKMAGVEAGS